MIRSNIDLNPENFIVEIDLYNKGKTNSDEHAASRLCNYISNNINIVEESVKDLNQRELFASFAKRIKGEFPNLIIAAKVADDINYYVSLNFFNIFDIIPKKIFPLLTTQNSDEYHYQKSGLENISSVSKNFNAFATIAKNDWVQENFIPLKFFMFETENEAVNYIIDYDFQKINLKGFYSINEDNLQKLSKQHILSLKIDSESIKIWPKFESLTYLEPLFVTDEGLIIIAKACPNLKIINLTETQISNEGVANLLEACPNLEELRVGETKISGEGMTEPRKTYPKISTFHAGGADLTKKGIVEIANAFPNLTDINICNIDFSDDWLEELVNNLPNLTTIVLAATFVTDKGLEILLKSGLKVKTLDVNTTNVTVNGVEEFIKASSCLREITLSECDLNDEEFEMLEKKYPNVKFNWWG